MRGRSEIEAQRVVERRRAVLAGEVVARVGQLGEHVVVEIDDQRGGVSGCGLGADLDRIATHQRASARLRRAERVLQLGRASPRPARRSCRWSGSTWAGLVVVVVRPRGFSAVSAGAARRLGVRGLRRGGAVRGAGIAAAGAGRGRRPARASARLPALPRAAARRRCRGDRAAGAPDARRATSAPRRATTATAPADAQAELGPGAQAARAASARAAARPRTFRRRRHRIAVFDSRASAFASVSGGYFSDACGGTKTFDGSNGTPPAAPSAR